MLVDGLTLIIFWGSKNKWNPRFAQNYQSIEFRRVDCQYPLFCLGIFIKFYVRHRTLMENCFIFCFRQSN